VPPDLVATFEVDSTLDGSTVVIVDDADVLDVDFGFGPANLPPEYTTSTVNTGQQIRVGEAPAPLAATDADGDVLTYAVVSGTPPSGLTLNPDGTWTGTAQAAGVFIISVEVCDTSGECETTSLNIEVTGSGPPPA